MEETFLSWTRDITKGTSFGSQKIVLTEEHLAPLLKVKSFHPVLRQLIRRARPQSERQHIRLNLNHLSLRKRLLEEKATNKLQEKRSFLGASLQEARKDVSQEALELKAVVEEEERLLREERDLRRQIALLSVAAEEKENKTETIKRWKDSIAQAIPEEAVRFSSAPQQKSLKQDFAEDELKSILEKLKVLKNRLLDKQNEDVHDDKLEVWRLVESYLGQHSPSDVLRALVTSTTKEKNALTNMTQEIDLVSDARALRLKYEPSGALVDELGPQGVLETIESMLVQMCGKHVKNHFRNEKEREDIQNSAESIRNIKNNVNSVAKNLYSDPSLVSEIMKLLEETIQLSSLRAALSASAPLSRRLETRALEATAAKEKMVKEFEQIHRFEDQVKKDVFSLKSLSMGASQSWDLLEEERRAIMSIAERGVASLEFPVPFLKGGFIEEVEAVMGLPFQYLQTFQTMGPVDCPAASLSSLSCCAPYVTSWDHVISLIRQRKCALRQNQVLLVSEVDSLEAMAIDVKKEALAASQIKELKDKARSQDSALEEKIAPLLDLCEQTNDEMQRSMMQAREVIDEWWSQPGPVIKAYLKKKKQEL